MAKKTSKIVVPNEPSEVTEIRNKILNEFNDLVFKELYIEDNELDVIKYGIKDIPSILLLDENDELIYKISGDAPLNDVSSIISYVLNRE